MDRVESVSWVDKMMGSLAMVLLSPLLWIQQSAFCFLPMRSAFSDSILHLSLCFLPSLFVLHYITPCHFLPQCVSLFYLWLRPDRIPSLASHSHCHHPCLSLALQSSQFIEVWLSAIVS